MATNPTGPARAVATVLTLLTVVLAGATTAYADLAGPRAVSASRAVAITQVSGWSTRALRVAPGSRHVFRVRLLSRVGRAGRPVVLQRRSSAGGSWTRVARTTTDATGRARLAWVAPRTASRGWLRVRAVPHGGAAGVVTGRRLATVVVPPDPVDPRITDVLDLVNRARATAHTCGSESFPAVPALRLDAQLDDAAGDYARRMASEDFLDHTSPDGDGPGERLTAAGYAWHAWGENIAAGQDTPDEVVAAWLHSPGHCSNLMSPQFADVGIGVAIDRSSAYGTYWVQDFGRAA